MKKTLFVILAIAFCCSAFAQSEKGRSVNTNMFEARLDLEEVYRDGNVVFRKIDEHTWIGSGHVMASETLYLIEGKKRDCDSRA